jgi:putative transposase
MPWLETSPMEQRKEFVEAAMRGEYSFTELCRRFRISRKNGYKWLNRYRIELAFPGGRMSFADRSRRPRNSPTAISPEIETAIVELKRTATALGTKKLRVVLANQNPDIALPSESTFAAVFKRNGLVKPRRKRAKSTPYTAPLGHAQQPNAVWAMDFKGDFSVGRTRCYPLTITDSYSRCVIACVALTNTRAETVNPRSGAFLAFPMWGGKAPCSSQPTSPPAMDPSSHGRRPHQIPVWWLDESLARPRTQP